MTDAKYMVLVRVHSMAGNEAKNRFDELAQGWMNTLVGVEQIRLLVHGTNQKETLCFLAFTFDSKEAYEELLKNRIWAPAVIMPLRNDSKLRFAASMIEEATTDPQGYRAFHTVPAVLSV